MLEIKINRTWYFGFWVAWREWVIACEVTGWLLQAKQEWKHLYFLSIDYCKEKKRGFYLIMISEFHVSCFWSQTSTLEGNVALLLKGSGVEKGSIFVVFLKKSSDEDLNGSVSLNGSPPKGSTAEMMDNFNVLGNLKWTIEKLVC